MPGNIVGEAWVEILPDLSGFEEKLLAGVKAAMASAQAYADANPINVKVRVESTAAVAEVAAAMKAMQSRAEKPIRSRVKVDTEAAVAEVTKTIVVLQKQADAAPTAMGMTVRDNTEMLLISRMGLIRADTQRWADSHPVDIPVIIDTTFRDVTDSAASTGEGAAGMGGGDGGGGGGRGGRRASSGGKDDKKKGPGWSNVLMGALGLGGAATALPFIGGALPGAFSILSLAGLGVEHVLTTIIGLVGSLAGAIMGGALLAFGSLSVAMVGMGSDMLVMRQAAQNVTHYTTAMDALNKAIALHGANSSQAAAAQYNLNQLTQTWSAQMTAAVQQTAAAKEALTTLWQTVSQQAQIAAMGIQRQVYQLGQTYAPLVANAAATNFAIIGEAIKPLMSWLAGPGAQVFLHLEQQFSKNLPQSVHAFTMAIEFAVKTMDFLAPYVGTLIDLVDRLLTRANSPSGFHAWQGIMVTLIGMFHTWFDFFKVLTQDVVQFFALSVGVGTAIVSTLTGMLTRLHEWLSLATTQTSLVTIFELHKQEVIALLNLLPPLLSALGNIYLNVAPALTGAMVTVLQAIVPILNAIASNSWGAWILGLTLITAKLGILNPILSLTGPLIGGLVARLAGMATASAAVATATDAVAASATGVAAETETMVSKGTKAFSLMSLATNPVVLAIAGIGIAAALVAMNWDSISGGFRSQADKMARAVKEVDTGWAKLNDDAASKGIAGITNNLGGFTQALHAASLEIDQNYVPAIDDAVKAQQAAFDAQAGIAAKQAAGSNAPRVTSGRSGVGTGAGAAAADLKIQAAAAAEASRLNTGLVSSLYDLQLHFGGLSKPVQALINELFQSDKTGRDATAMFERMRNVHEQALPTWDATGKMIGSVSMEDDNYRNGLLATVRAGGKHAEMAKAAIVQWDATGGAIGNAAQQLISSEPAWKAMYDSVMSSASAQDIASGAAQRHARELADNLVPAGATLHGVIDKMTRAYNDLHPEMKITNDQEWIMIQNNPELLKAFIRSQQAAQDDADRFAALNNQLSQIPGYSYNAQRALQNLANARGIANAAAAAAGHGQSGGIQAAEGAIVSGPTTGFAATLHGTEAVVPKNKATPQLWAAMVDAINGGSNVQTIASTRTAGQISYAPSGGGDVHIEQHFHNNGGSMAEMQAIVQRENASLVMAIRSGAR